MNTTSPVTFEERFGVYTPINKMILTTIDGQQEILKSSQNVGLIIRALAYLIDIGLAFFVVPIFINIYLYLKRGQSLGYKAIGARIYHYNSTQEIANISQLITRFIVKFTFLCTWAIFGVNLVMMLFDGIGYDTYYNFTHGTLYTIVMFVWIHGYAITMFSSPMSRGIHDMISNSKVCYDEGYSVKKILLSLIGCAVLYYIIICFGPIIIQRISNYISSQLGHGYWATWTWIDNLVVSGLKEVNF